MQTISDEDMAAVAEFLAQISDEDVQKIENYLAQANSEEEEVYSFAQTDAAEDLPDDAMLP